MVKVRVIPRSRKSAVIALGKSLLKVRVLSPPTDNRATSNASRPPASFPNGYLQFLCVCVMVYIHYTHRVLTWCARCENKIAENPQTPPLLKIALARNCAGAFLMASAFEVRSMPRKRQPEPRCICMSKRCSLPLKRWRIPWQPMPTKKIASNRWKWRPARNRNRRIW